MRCVPTSNHRLMLVLFAVLTATASGCASSHPNVQCPETAVLSSETVADTADQTAPLLDYTKKLDDVADIDAAVDKVKAALTAQGFGVVSDMDMQATIEEKLGEKMKPYRILGACNPKLAFQAISRQKTMGLLLPCNVIVYQDETGGFTVSFARPQTVFSLVDDSDSGLASVAQSVDGLIRAAFESL